MTRFLAVAAMLAGFCGLTVAEDHPLNRDEVSVIKKKFVACFEALGKAQAGYAMEDEDFNLPTEAYKNDKSGKFNPIGCSSSRKYGTEKAQQKSSEEMSKEYQKKMLEAQAKGDYATMSKMAQEMNQKMSQQQLSAVDAKKEPVDVSVEFNDYGGATIDPDAVVFERPGVIALKTKDDAASDKGTVVIYCDPVNLKDTKQLSRVELKKPDDGVNNRIAVLSVTFHFRGPLKEIEEWAKRVDTKKALAQVDAAK
jgi:hypothetical protein